MIENDRPGGRLTTTGGAPTRSLARRASRATAVGVLIAVLAYLVATSAHSQNRGVYPLGLTAINSGVSAAPGFTYSNAFLFYSRSEQVGGNGEVLATGQQSVLLDMNTILWASAGDIAMLGGARFSTAVTIPIANNSLSSDAQGAISSGGGLGIFTFNPLFLAGKTNAPTFAAFSAFWHRPANSTPVRATMWVAGIGRRRSQRAKHSTCPRTGRPHSPPSRSTNSIPLNRARIFIRASRSTSTIHS